MRGLCDQSSEGSPPQDLKRQSQFSNIEVAKHELKLLRSLFVFPMGCKKASMAAFLRDCVGGALNVQELIELYEFGGSVECLVGVLDGGIEPVSVHGNKIINTLGGERRCNTRRVRRRRYHKLLKIANEQRSKKG